MPWTQNSYYDIDDVVGVHDALTFYSINSLLICHDLYIIALFSEMKLKGSYHMYMLFILDSLFLSQGCIRYYS